MVGLCLGIYSLRFSERCCIMTGMAVETITKLIDDVDGSPADQTVEFSFLGARYEIDLTEKHTDQMRKALEPWLERARRARGGNARRKPAQARRTPKAAKPKPTNDEIRAWAKEKGIKVAEKGRIANAVIDQYMAEA